MAGGKRGKPRCRGVGGGGAKTGAKEDVRARCGNGILGKKTLQDRLISLVKEKRKKTIKYQKTSRIGL